MTATALAPLVVLVTGGRNYADEEHIHTSLDRLHHEIGPIAELMHGDARGVDRISGAWGRAAGVGVSARPADWKRFPKAAGPIRNSQMLAEVVAKVQSQAWRAVTVAFPGGTGTADMVRKVRAKGIDVVEIPERQVDAAPDRPRQG